MKKLCLALCLCILLAMTAGAVTPALPPEQTTDYVLYQMGNTLSAENGAVVPVTNSTGDALAPYVSSGGSVMLPLAHIAKKFGFTLGWDGETKQTTLSYGGTKISLSVGSAEAAVNGKKITLPSAVTIWGAATFVPSETLNYFDVLYTHRFPENQGDFFLITTTERSAEALASFSSFGLRLLGPSRASFAASALTFREDSSEALVFGAETDIVSDSASATPYSTADGYLMIPLQFAATSMGFGYIRYSNCCAMTANGVKFGFYFGEHYVERAGQVYKSSKYYCEVKRGVVYVSASAFAYAADQTTNFGSSPVGVVFSDYSSYPSLTGYSASLIASLPAVDRSITGYLALTFDDGPSGALTERLLDGLMERGAHATFFLCNYRIASYSSPMTRYVAEGHEVANHGASHSALTGLSALGVDEELDSTNASINAYTGTTPVLCRPAGGSYNSTVLDELAKRGMSCILWSVDPLDWKFLNTEKVVNNIVSTASDGNIILLHDLYATSVDAALQVIDILSQRGFAFVTVSELAKIKGYDLAAGAVYTGFK